VRFQINFIGGGNKTRAMTKGPIATDWPPRRDLLERAVRGQPVVDTVDALVATDAGERFDANHSRPMKEWLAGHSDSTFEWLKLAREALGLARLFPRLDAFRGHRRAVQEPKALIARLDDGAVVREPVQQGRFGDLAMRACESKFGELAELGSLRVGKLHCPQDSLDVLLYGPAHGNPRDGNALHS